MIVATTQFSLRAVDEPEQFWRRVRSLCKEAHKQAAKFILFPEYFSLSMLLSQGRGSFRERILSSATLEKYFLKQFQEISEEFSLCIIAGTLPHVEGKGKIVNRCWIFRPEKKAIFQDKIHMTRFESEAWKIKTNKPLISVFKHEGVKCAVAICYDIEFPDYCATIAASRADIIFVPSCTDDIHGYWRVRHCAEARGIENQAYLAVSSIVEGNPGFPEISEHHGKGVIITPCDVGFPPGGIAVEGQSNLEGIAISKLDIDLLQKIRRNGTVLNLRDRGKKKIRLKTTR